MLYASLILLFGVPCLFWMNISNYKKKKKKTKEIKKEIRSILLLLIQFIKYTNKWAHCHILIRKPKTEKSRKKSSNDNELIHGLHFCFQLLSYHGLHFCGSINLQYIA